MNATVIEKIKTVEQLYEVRPDTCEPAREWLDENGITTLAEAWDQCDRADWMLWLDGALDLLTDRVRRLIACRCVRETPLSDGRKVWDLLTDERSRQAVAVAERYAAGEATDEQLADAWTAADAAAMAAADVMAVAAAAVRPWNREEAAAWAARAAARAAAAVRPWNGAEAAAAARAAAAVRTARAEAWLVAAAARAVQADLVREIAGNPWRGKEA